MLEHSRVIIPEVMGYIKRRRTQAPRGSDFALNYVKDHGRPPQEREQVCQALIFKTNVLWLQLDARHHAYVTGEIPTAPSAPIAPQEDPAAAPRPGPPDRDRDQPALSAAPYHAAP